MQRLPNPNLSQNIQDELKQLDFCIVLELIKLVARRSSVILNRRRIYWKYPDEELYKFIEIEILSLSDFIIWFKSGTGYKTDVASLSHALEYTLYNYEFPLSVFSLLAQTIAETEMNVNLGLVKKKCAWGGMLASLITLIDLNEQISHIRTSFDNRFLSVNFFQEFKFNDIFERQKLLLNGEGSNRDRRTIVLVESAYDIAAPNFEGSGILYSNTPNKGFVSSESHRLSGRERLESYPRNSCEVWRQISQDEAFESPGDNWVQQLYF